MNGEVKQYYILHPAEKISILFLSFFIFSVFSFSFFFFFVSWKIYWKTFIK